MAKYDSKYFQELFEKLKNTDFSFKAKGAYDKFKSKDLNIFVVGKTGVGKSSLINAVFGKDMAETGSGKPVSQKIDCYSNGKEMNIYDSRGIEASNSEETYLEIEKFLEENMIKEVNKQIHIAWLCIDEPGRRIDCENRLFKMLKEKNIPTIIVITKAESDKDKNGIKFSDLVKEEFKTEDIVRTRAVEKILDDGNDEDDEDKTIIKVMGINNLVKLTEKLLPEGQSQAFRRKQAYDEKIRKEAMKEEAQRIVNYYASGSGVAAATPIPFSDIAVILPTQLAMIAHITKIYNLDLSNENSKKIALGCLATIAGGYSVRFVVGGLLKFIPVAGSVIGGAVSALAAGTTTKILGNAYIEFLDNNFESIIEDPTKFFDLFSIDEIISNILKYCSK